MHRGRRARKSDLELALKKFLEHNRDPGRRLKSLRHAEEKAAKPTEVKQLYVKYSSAIFFVFYSYFGTLEAAILEKANKGRGYSEVHLKELRDNALPALERIIVYLPELVHKKWQYNSICLVIRKLLHPDNVLMLRKDGLRLLILWLQALQSNAGDACMQLFASAVPHFPPQKTPMGLPVPPSSSSSSSSSPSLLQHSSSLSLVERYGTYSSSSVSGSPNVSSGRRSSAATVTSVRDVVKVSSIQPLHQAVYSAAESTADDDVTVQLINHLMDCLTTQVGRLHWEDVAQHLHGFAFLFFLFKLFYLACLFKNFRTEAGLYSQPPPPDIKVRVGPDSVSVGGKLGALREEETSLDRGTRSPSPSTVSSSPSVSKHVRRTGGYRMSQVIKLDYDLSHPVYTVIKQIILQRVLSWLQPDKESAVPLKSPLPSPSMTPTSPLPPQSASFIRSGVDLICEMWFTSRDNVNLLCEICRQSFLANLVETRPIRRVIDLYWSWVNSSGDQPPFMVPPMTRPEQLVGASHLSVPNDPVRVSSPASVQPWEVIIHYEGHDTSDVCVGVQPVLRMMIRHTSQVFLATESEETRSSQLELCRRVLQFYQDVVMKWSLDHDTWEYLLSTLLYLTLELLRGGPPPDRDNSLPVSLSASLLKTLLVCYLRASMVTTVSDQLWNSLSTVLASLTQWKEVIDLWKFGMETMTRILAESVYGLNLNDLPLQRLLKEEGMIGKQRSRAPTTVPSDLGGGRLTSFSIIEVNMKRPTTSSSAVERRSHAMRQKAVTLDVPETEYPPENVRRYRSIPNETHNYFLTGSGEGNDRSVSAVNLPIDSQMTVPLRSSSSEVRFRTIKEEEGEEEGEGAEGGSGRASPAVSLPPTMMMSSTSCLQHSERAREGESNKGRESRESLTITNQHIRTPTPEPELTLTSVQSSFEHGGRGGSVEPLLEAQDEDKGKGKPKKSWRKKLNFSDLSGGSKSQKKHTGTDLVLKNESSDESVTLKDEQSPLVKADHRSSPLASLPASSAAGISERERQRSSSVADDGVSEGETRVSSRIYKSSSEGNLHRLSQLAEMEEEEGEGGCEQSVLGSVSPLMLRRVVSSDVQDTTNQPKNKEGHGVTEDIFSSAIIPSSQARLLSSPVGPRSQSPVIPALSPVRPSSQLALRRGADHKDRRSVGSEGATVGGEGSKSKGESSGIEGSREAEFPATPLNHHMMMKKSVAIDRPRTPSPPITTISPSSPTHTQGGWTPVVSAVVWQRMLRVLGDINKICDPSMHYEAFQTLLCVWKHLVELEANLGVSTDNQTTPPLPKYLPPVLVFLPWVLRACTLPPDFLSGRTVAIQLLCEMNICHVLTQPSLQQLTLFYQLLQCSLQPSSDTLNIAVKHCSKLYSHGLPGAGVLLGDCITACSTILTVKSRRSDVPRSEALCLLGSMLFLPHLSPQLKSRLVSAVITTACKEPTKTPRCQALHLAGMLVFSELYSGQPSSHVPEAVNVLLTSLRFSDRSVSMTAIDMLTLLTEVAPQMYTAFPVMPGRVLQGLSHSVAVFMTDPELEKAPWVSKVVVTLLMCLRDWLMVLPLHQMVRDTHLSHKTLQETFEVLQTAAISSQQAAAKRHAIAQLASIRTPVYVNLDPLESLTAHTMSLSTAARSSRSFRSREEGSEPTHRPLFGSEDEDRVQLAARSVLTHLINLVGHFPFGCGPAQMTSIVSEFHDAPSLKHLNDLSTEIFDSPRVQIFSFNDTAVVTLVEIPIEHTGLPPTVEPAHYHSRVIVRDVTGKYAWDCAMLYGPQLFPQPGGIPLITAGGSEESLTMAEPGSLEGGGGGVASSVVDPIPYSEDPLRPPSWKLHANFDKDVLEDLLKHIESTSPECLLYPGVAGLAEPAPVTSKAVRSLESEMVDIVQRQHTTEADYTQSASTLHSMCSTKEAAPHYISAEFAYHHCRVLLSHLGMFSASRRDHLDLLERNNQLILELKHLDSTPAQSRMTYKVAVLYVAPGQEDRQSMLRNSSGSPDFEEFVSGLGWEVNMETHAGYMGGLKREFCAHTTLPYYATSSEEVLFHVSTRMPSKRLDVEQKVRHLGNDEVHIVWSDHWRDYRRTIFKTQFADILIVIYPLPNRLFRIQIIKKQKQNIPLFGPLFDGAVVNRKTLSSLVRATAINALRAQRSPLVGYRGRYEERMKNIQTIVQRKMKLSFEEFVQNVMHPLESSSTARVSARHQTPELEPLPPPLCRQAGSGLRSFNQPRMVERISHAETIDINPYRKRGISPRFSQLRSNTAPDTHSPPLRRPRANTNDSHISRPSVGSDLHRHHLPRNRSVPEKLHRLHHTEEDSGVDLSASGTNLTVRRPVNIRRRRTASPSPVSQLSGPVPDQSGTS